MKEEQIYYIEVISSEPSSNIIFTLPNKELLEEVHKAVEKATKRNLESFAMLDLITIIVEGLGGEMIYPKRVGILVDHYWDGSGWDYSPDIE